MADYLDIAYLPNSGSTDVYRLAYDSVQSADPLVAETFDLGERLAAPGGNDRITGFTLGDEAGAPNAAAWQLTGFEWWGQFDCVANEVRQCDPAASQESQ